MKGRILLLISALVAALPLTLKGQSDAIDLLQDAYNKCQAIEHGQYDMLREMKYLSDHDTTTYRYSCHFSKQPVDTLFGCLFHYKFFYEDTFSSEVLYTGDALISCSTSDSICKVTSTERWSEHIDAISHNYEFYTPFTSPESSPLPTPEELDEGKMQIVLHDREHVNNRDCHHMRVTYIPDNDPDEPIITLRHELDLWIDTLEMIPLKYAVAYDLIMNNDTMYQYERVTLLNYTLHTVRDTTMLTPVSLPDHYVLEDYVPYEPPEPLPIDTFAPDWTLPTMYGDTLSLSAMGSELVLIDFFYKSCYPCLLAIPHLQELHNNYADKGLAVIGIDPFDDHDDDIVVFLEKRGVTYPILLEGREVAEAYRVSGYPTFYLLNSASKVIYVGQGFGEEAHEELEMLIRNILE